MNPALPLLALLLTACSDAGLKVYNSGPNVTFTSPAEGGEVASGVSLTLVAQVADRETLNDELLYFWTRLDGSTLEGAQTITATQVTLVTATGFPEGEQGVILTVTDPEAASATDTLHLTARPDASPVGTFNLPLAASRHPEGEAIEVDLLVEDPDEADLTRVSLTWSGPGAPVAPAAPNSDGHVRFFIEDAPLGDNELSVLLVDSAGGSARASVAFVVALRDADGDGFESEEWGGDDCDDADPAISPEAEEVCDGVDNDCDGEIDEDTATDASIFYVDDDGDAYGVDTFTLAACDPPVGYVAALGDCDDADPAEHPGADEVCDGDDDDCDGEIDEADAIDPATWYADADTDGHGDAAATASACEAPAGYVGLGDDCDDAAPAVFPGADEYCNDIDDNCDGAIDEAAAVDAPLWYTDADADTYGDASAALAACDPPAGRIATGGDCDDADAAIHPGATEVCDSVDNDCDARVDDADSPVTGTTTFYRDADADTYGLSSATTQACLLPAGYAARAGDCDDAALAINPGATEQCDAANTDEDCDGLADDADPAPTGTTAWYRDADHDTYGDLATTTRACDAPATYVADATDCDDTRASVSPADTEVCGGLDDDCDGLVDDADPSLTGAPTWYGDVDADTYGDATLTAAACLVPSGYTADATDCDDLVAAVHPGATETCLTAYDDDCDGVTNVKDALGCVPYYRDNDSDGWGSAASACYCAASGSYTTAAGGDCDDSLTTINPGAAEVCEDGVDQNCDLADQGCLLSGTIDLSVADVKIIGTSYTLQLGTTVAGAGDIDGDGYADLLLGAFSVGTNLGYAYVIEGPLAASDTVDNLDLVRFTGSATGDYFSRDMAGGADVNGDGLDDILFSASGADPGGTDSGAAYLFYGEPGTTRGSGATLADVVFVGDRGGDAFGNATAMADLDDDGYGDLIFGATSEDSGGSGAGAAYLFYGPRSASRIDATDYDAILVGEVAGDSFGASADAVGDFDGDGFVDIGVGATLATGSATTSGSAYIFDGVQAGVVDASAYTYKINGVTTADNVGGRVSGAGDTNADGYDDVLLGAPAADPAGSASGTVWLMSGGATGLATTASALAKVQGAVAGDQLGYSVDGPGDVNGDGYMDVFIGAYGDDAGGGNAGGAFLYYGPLVGTYAKSDADAIFVGEKGGDFAGYSVAGVGDVSGDGFPDLLVGAYAADTPTLQAGAVYLIEGGQ